MIGACPDRVTGVLWQTDRLGRLLACLRRQSLVVRVGCPAVAVGRVDGLRACSRPGAGASRTLLRRRGLGVRRDRGHNSGTAEALAPCGPTTRAGLAVGVPGASAVVEPGSDGVGHGQGVEVGRAGARGPARGGSLGASGSLASGRPMEVHGLAAVEPDHPGRADRPNRSPLFRSTRTPSGLPRLHRPGHP